MATESKPSAFETVFAAYAVVATFVLGFGYWRLATRQNEQDARIEQHRDEQEKALVRLQREAEDKRAADSLELEVITLVAPHLSRLREPGREAATSQKIVAVAAEFLASKGRPGLLQMAQRLREDRVPVARSEARAAAEPGASLEAPSGWLVLLATLPGDGAKAAERTANEKLRAARELGMAGLVSIYKTRLKGRYVIVIGGPRDKSTALAAAAQAREQGLSIDAFAEPVAGWQLVGAAPFPAEVKSASAD